jgi:hypothetical protein
MPCSTRHRRRADHSKPHGCHPFTRMEKLRGRRNKSLQLSFCRNSFSAAVQKTAQQQSKAMRVAVCAVIALGAAAVSAASPHTVRVIGVIICPRPTFTFILVRRAPQAYMAQLVFISAHAHFSDADCLAPPTSFNLLRTPCRRTSLLSFNDATCLGATS